MKKYNSSFSCYGQSTAGRIAYHQKMGVANGIIQIIKHRMRNEGLNLKDWEEPMDIGNGTVLKFMHITVVIPTPDDIHEVIEDYPIFHYNGKWGYIDMLHLNGELQFHIMRYDREEKVFKNCGWHTVREGMSLEDTCTLFEYIEDRLKDLIILPLSEHGKYNETGALGVGITI